jgi:antitoxin PrlF
MPVTEDLSPTQIRTRLSENGRIVIPAHLRNALGFEPGEELLLVIEDGELRVTTPRKRAERAQLIFKRYARSGPSLTQELIADRRREAAE